MIRDARHREALEPPDRGDSGATAATGVDGRKDDETLIDVCRRVMPAELPSSAGSFS